MAINGFVSEFSQNFQVVLTFDVDKILNNSKYIGNLIRYNFFSKNFFLNKLHRKYTRKCLRKKLGTFSKISDFDKRTSLKL